MVYIHIDTSQMQANHLAFAIAALEPYVDTDVLHNDLLSVLENLLGYDNAVEAWENARKTIEASSYFLTTDQAAEVLEITRRRVLALIAAGRLPAEKSGRDWRIRSSDLDLVKMRHPGRPPGPQNS